MTETHAEPWQTLFSDAQVEKLTRRHSCAVCGRDLEFVCYRAQGQQLGGWQAQNGRMLAVGSYESRAFCNHHLAEAVAQTYPECLSPKSN